MLEDLRSGEVGAEAAEQMVSVLDTLLSVARLEVQEAQAERPATVYGQEGSEQEATSSEKRGGG